MSYCSNCGSKVDENAKFCSGCRAPLRPEKTSSETNQRQKQFVGKIYKCPNCGETLQSFTRNCPSCGHEIRDVEASSTVNEFLSKLDEIEKNLKIVLYCPGYKRRNKNKR